MMENTHRNRRGIIPSYSSYKDFIEKNVEEWPQYRWLQTFFNHVGGSADETRITAFDSIGGNLLETAFSVTDPSRFRNFLDARTSNVQTRIIVLAYKETWSVDRTFIDILASHLGLSPDNLQTHLIHTYQVLESVPTQVDHILRKSAADQYLRGLSYGSHLPSEQIGQSKTLQLDSDWGDRNTVICVRRPQEHSSTVLILLRQRDKEFSPRTVDRLNFDHKPLPPVHDSEVHIYNKVIDSIKRINVEDVSMCDADPILYSYHVFRPWLLEQFDSSNLSCSDDHLDKLGVEDIEVELSLLQLQRQFVYSLQITMRKQHFSDSKSDYSEQIPTIAVKMRGLVDDLDVLCEKWNLAISVRRHVMNKILVEAQLEEAEQSRSTAISVATLTRIATVYIPLNFTASFFGMNMAEFGNGTGSLWLFVVTALVFAGITAIPFASLLIDWIQGRPAMKESPWVITFRMAYYFPAQGFWLALFWLFHSIELMNRVCDDGLYSYRLNGGKKEKMRYLTKNLFFASFWRERLRKVFEVTENPARGKHSFVSRVWTELFSSNQTIKTGNSSVSPSV